MDSIGKIRGFCHYSPQQLLQMKQDLHISLSVPQLQYCASYYAKEEKRDPAIDEMKLLDCFVSSYPLYASPIELLTNDTAVAESYADIMQKRRTLNPDAKYPCDLWELHKTADRYLARAGKPTALPNALFRMQETAQGLSRAVTANGADFGIQKFSDCKGSEAKKGDLFLLIRPWEYDKTRKIQTSVWDFCRNKAISSKLRQVTTVSKYGLLHSLMKQTQGLQIELSRLSVLGEEVPLSMLCTAYIGDCLIRISPDDYEAIRGVAIISNLRAQVFAAVTDGCAYTFIRNKQGDCFSLLYSFLRTLLPYRPVRVRLANEERLHLSPIQKTVLSTAHSAYLYSDENRRHTQTEELNGTLCAPSFSAPENSYFFNAFDTVLSSVMTLCAAGIDYAEQRLALGIKLPMTQSDPVCAAESVSTLLGIYRLQAELGIPSADSVLSLDDVPHPRVTAGAIGNGQSALPSSFTSCGNRVYCLSPSYYQNGLPCFQSLRKLLDRLSTLRREGVIQSAYVLCREPVTTGLQRMRTGSLGIRMTGDEWASEDAIPLAILLETNKEIEGRQVGTVIARTVSSKQKLPDLPPISPTTESACPSLTVVSRRNDLHAELLCEALEKRGAKVSHLVTGLMEDFFFEYIRSQTLILCTNVTMSNDRAILDACNEFYQSGGRVLRVGDGIHAKYPNSVAFPNGLSEEILEKLCK